MPPMLLERRDALTHLLLSGNPRWPGPITGRAGQGPGRDGPVQACQPRAACYPRRGPRRGAAPGSGGLAGQPKALGRSHRDCRTPDSPSQPNARGHGSAVGFCARVQGEKSVQALACCNHARRAVSIAAVLKRECELIMETKEQLRNPGGGKRGGTCVHSDGAPTMRLVRGHGS